MGDRLYDTERIYWIGNGLWDWSKKRTRGFFDDGRQAGKPVQTIAGHLEEFEQVHEWLWGKETPHKEFETTERDVKRLMNALCYNKGRKGVLAYNLHDLESCPALCDEGESLVWLTEAARLGAWVYFVEKVMRAHRFQFGELTLDEFDKELLATQPNPDAVQSFDSIFGKRKRRV